MARSNRSGRVDDEAIARNIAMFREVEAIVREKTGRVVENMKVLDIGAGQLAYHLRYFSARNDAIGIDMDVYPRPWHPLDWLTLLRRNGPRRLVKTAGRRIMGVDRRLRAGMARHLGVDRLREPRVLYMDATRMEFPDASFDFVYSFDVFEHIAEPELGLRQVVRVLKPGGVAYISLQHWTSDNGCHDLRVINRARTDLPHWGHLRPARAADVQRDAFCNELSVSSWRKMFEQIMPGAQLSLSRSDRVDLAPELALARAAGELGDYTDEELLAPRLVAVWQKHMRV